MQLPQRFILEGSLLLLTSYSLGNTLAGQLSTGEAVCAIPRRDLLAPTIMHALCKLARCCRTECDGFQQLYRSEVAMAVAVSRGRRAGARVAPAHNPYRCVCLYASMQFHQQRKDCPWTAYLHLRQRHKQSPSVMLMQFTLHVCGFSLRVAACGQRHVSSSASLDAGVPAGIRRCLGARTGVDGVPCEAHARYSALDEPCLCIQKRRAADDG